ncbi:MAG: tyrosine-type recombinase/integrase [Firmicutes bacterium]|nr:tyrosine-type recombinase/integrase [Bacillota bacterium]
MELEQIVMQQSEQIGKLTDLFSQLLTSPNLANPPQNMVYLGVPEGQNRGHVFFENLIATTNANGSFSSKSKTKEEEHMQKLIEKILATKNCCIKHDGRFRWQKMINRTRFEIIDTDPKRFLKRVSELKRQLKQNATTQPQKPKTDPVQYEQTKYILFDECKKYVELYKGDNDSNGKHQDKLLGVVNNHMANLTKDIRDYTQDDMQNFRNGLSKYKKVDKQCMLVLKPVFDNAVLKRLIPISPLTGTKSKAQKSDKRDWIHTNDQKKIFDNILNPSTPKIARHVKKLGNEWLFYFVSGCRDEEALNITPFWDKNIIFIGGTKTDNAPRYVKLSPYASHYFKARWGTMWKRSNDPHYYSKNTTPFLKDLGINGKSLHNIRHSFSTNIFYLGATEAEHRYMMGHSDIKMTKNVYTKFDPTVDKDDILAVWGEWYPENFVLKPVLNNIPKVDQIDQLKAS